MTSTSDFVGAVYLEGDKVPLHFGDPVTEQLQYEDGQGLHYAGTTGVVAVVGPDRLSWLTSMSTQVVTDLNPGQSKELLFLDHNGRITFACGIIDDRVIETAWLLIEVEQAGALRQFLESMRFMLRVAVEDRSADYQTYLSVNDLVPAPAGILVWDDPWPGVEEGGARYFVADHPGEKLRIRHYVVPTSIAAEFTEHWFATHPKGRWVGKLAAEATRVGTWRPRWSAEVDERSLPAELDWLRSAVHLTKGCYSGQESVARIVNLGKPPRRLTFLQLDGFLGSLPNPGDPVELNGRQVGVITSVARHAEMGPIALALLKRTVDPAAPLTIGDIAAAQELIVPVEGRSDHSPEVRPGAGLKRLDHGGRDIRTMGPGAGV